MALTAAATAVAGPISFVALAAPQLAHRLARTAGVALVPSAAMGALLLVASDLVAQRAFAPTHAPGRCGHRLRRWALLRLAAGPAGEEVR